MEGYSVAPGVTTLRDYLRVVFRHKLIVIISVAVVTATVLVGLIFQTPLYEARVKMLISAEKQVESPYYQELLTDRNIPLVLTQSEIVKSDPVIGMTVMATGLYARPLNYEKNFASIFKKPFIKIGNFLINRKLNRLPEKQKMEILYRLAIDELKARTGVEPIRDTNLFVISVRDYSPLGVAMIANALSRAYVIFDLQQQFAELQLKYGEKHSSTIQLKDSIEKMSESLNGMPLPDVEAIGPASVKIIEQASIPRRPVGLPKPTVLLLAFVMSIFLGIMLAFTFEYMDQTFRSPRDIESFLNLPFLGSVPKLANIAAYRNVADQIYLVIKNKGFKSVLVTTALPEEGATTVVANLGRHFAESSKHKVLLIDANLRNPGLHSALGVEMGRGLSEILENKASLDDSVQKISAHLALLSAGQTELNPITLLDSDKMPEIIKSAKKDYDIILLDCPNLREYKDTVIIALAVDGIALVVTEGKTRRQVAKAALSGFNDKAEKLLGVILNQRTFAIPQKIYERI